MNAFLYYPEENPTVVLSTKDIVAKLALEMPIITIDWASADQQVEDRIKQMEDARLPSMLIESVREERGNIVFIEIRFPEFPDDWVMLHADPDSRLELRFGRPNEVEFARFSAERIAASLGLTFEFQSV